jgi:hypothetical protein
MTWPEHHSISEQFAGQAQDAVRRGDATTSTELYLRAAEEEILALQDIDLSKARTVGITAVSAASLFFKANALHQAERCAHQWLAWDGLPAFAADELRDILRAIRAKQEASTADDRPSLLGTTAPGVADDHTTG